MKTIDLPKVLVLQNNEESQEFLRTILREDCHVFIAPNEEEAFKFLDEANPDLILLEEIEILKRVRSLKPKTQVIMMMAEKKREEANEAKELGVFDYIHKPFDIEQLRVVVRRALEMRGLYDGVNKFKKELALADQSQDIIGSDSLKLFQSISQAVASQSNVLIAGESGTGKELVARVIHSQANRQGPFIVFRVRTIPERFLEIELFGHENGKRGVIEFAQRGTLFFEEIADIPFELQAKLLRVLKEKKFQRVGEDEMIPTDIQFVFTTTHTLEKVPLEQHFLKDLYEQGINIPIFLPPLREKRGDIPLLIDHFLSRFRKTMGTRVESFTPEALEILKNYSWPGNVRELKNAVENLAMRVNHPRVQPEDLFLIQSKRALLEMTEKRGSLDEMVSAFEKQLIEEALRNSNGVFTHAAKLLGTTRRILKYHIDQLNISVQKKNRRSKS